jgi:hypothetical protein
MNSLVLIGRPKSLHIMAMAMAAPSARESWWGYGKIEIARLGAQSVQWILTRGKERNIRLIRTRNYVPSQTAFYADWLLFQEDELACQFLTAFPRFQIANRLQGLQRDRQIIATRLEERLRRGGFDIGKHPPEQRRAIAQRFIELDDKLRDIDEHRRGIELAEQLSLEWTARLESITRSFDDTTTNTRTIALVWDEPCRRAADRLGCTVHKAFL